MYLVGDSFCVSFKWVVFISTKKEAAYKYTRVQRLHTLPLWSIAGNYKPV